ncbi:hypothetical protein ACEQPO_26335 [Bacillus sp. SL00103]
MIKVKADSIIHVVVATGEWGQDGLRYRRHRLAEFLASDPETKRGHLGMPVIVSSCSFLSAHNRANEAIDHS